MNNINTEQLVERVKNGDKTAVDELYRIYNEPLLKFIMKQGLSEFDAQDVVSETFMSMMEHIGQLRNNSQFSTWLHTIAKRKAGEHRKKDSRFQRVDFDTANSEDSDLSKINGDAAAVELAFENAYGDTVMLPENYAENEDIRNIIVEQINSLSLEHKETLFLFYYQNRSYAEIAELTGTNTNNVKARLHNAKKNIKKKLEELQNKGLVLCAVPFTMFIPHFKDAFGNVAIAGTAAATTASTAETLGSSASANAAHSVLAGTAASSSGAGAAAAASGIGLKAIVIAIAAVVTIGVGAAALKNIDSDNDNMPSVVSTTEESAAEEYLAVDSEISSVTEFESEEEEPEIDDSTESENQTQTNAFKLAVCKERYINMINDMMTEDAGVSYFFISDLDGDGIPEMDIEYYGADAGGSSQRKNAIFTFKDLEVVRFDADEYHEMFLNAMYYRYVDDTSGEIYTIIQHNQNSRAATLETNYYKLNENGISLMQKLHTVNDPEQWKYLSDPNASEIEYTIEIVSNKADVIRVIDNYGKDESDIPDTSSVVEPEKPESKTESKKPTQSIAKPTSPDELKGWQKAYYDYINDYTESHSDCKSIKFSLHDVDGDGVPELFVDSYLEAPSYGGTKGNESRLVTCNNENGCSELLCRDESGYENSFMDGGFTFTGYTPVVSMIVPTGAGAQYESYSEYFYKFENGSFTKLSDVVKIEYGRFGFTYWLNGAEIDEAYYKSKKADLLGSSEMSSTCSRVMLAEIVSLDQFTPADAFNYLADYGS